jgi:uncharacterized protein (TIGR02466 family)
MNIQRLWNIAPVATINCVDMGILTPNFNKSITEVAISTFDSYCNRSLEKTHHEKKRRSSQRSTSTSSDVNLTLNDFFFEYQKIHGFTRGLIHFNNSKEIKTLETVLEKHVMHYLSFLDSKSSHALNLYNDGILSLDIWAAVQHGDGAYHKNHVHEGAILSGVYYSSIPNGSAPLIMYKPRNTECANDAVDHHHVFTPLEGQLIIFPPWLLHGVPKATSTTYSPRVSFAFNLSGPIMGDPWNITR